MFNTGMAATLCFCSSSVTSPEVRCLVQPATCRSSSPALADRLGLSAKIAARVAGIDGGEGVESLQLAGKIEAVEPADGRERDPYGLHHGHTRSMIRMKFPGFPLPTALCLRILRNTLERYPLPWNRP